MVLIEMVMKLICQRGTTEYPYSIRFDDYRLLEFLVEVQLWCWNTFGKEYDGDRYRNFLNQWFFKDEQDRTLFILRWS